MWHLAACLTIASAHLVSSYMVALTGDRNVVVDGTVQFKAELYEDNGDVPSGQFRYIWEDNAIPQHKDILNSTLPSSTWNATYTSPEYSPGQYNVQVDVEKLEMFFIWDRVASDRIAFNITRFLNGDLSLSQGKIVRRKYVSNAEPLTHQVYLATPDKEYLNRTKNKVESHWFVDCIYYGKTEGYQFDYNYTKPDISHLVETLVVASYEPPVPTTTVAPTTVKPNTTTSTTTMKPSTTSTPKSNITDTNEISDVDGTDHAFKAWLSSFPNANDSKSMNATKSSHFCLNTSVIPLDPKKTYGIFRTNFTVRVPVKVAPINGTTWLMDGEILNMTVSCKGTPPFAYCVLKKQGLYNVTGDETCVEEKTIRNCSFSIQHLFKEPSEYTFVVIISNPVSRIVKPIAVNVYKVTKHAQLSVIIVPVAFSIVAVTLIIFGVAYYFQSKRTYTIEVADFDFGNQTSDMEYKTFRERLRESVSNSFLKSQDLTENDSGWSPNRKYGSMQ